MNPNRPPIPFAARRGLAAPIIAVFAAALVAGLAAAACDPVHPAAQARVYPMRGQVTQLPAAADPLRPIYIHHEPVRNFLDATGKTTTMESMTMPFELAPDVKLPDLQVGDKIAFDWSVNWKTNAAKVIRLEKLPNTTPLNFNAATSSTMSMPSMPSTSSTPVR